MIKLNEEKQQTEHLPVVKAKIPDKVAIPLSQHIGRPCQPVIKAGDLIKTGQLIATLSDKAVFSPIHSSVSGKVKAVQDYPHPLLGQSKAVLIESDGLDTNIGFKTRSKEEVGNLTPDDLRKIIFDAGIVGMGGAGFPAHIKLNPPKPIDSFILNGAECEPYLTSDNCLMIEKAKEILTGIEIIVKCTGVKNVYITIENNKPEAIKIFNSLLIHGGTVAKYPKSVIPAKAGIYNINRINGSWIPAFAGMTRNAISQQSHGPWTMDHGLPKLIIIKSGYPQGGEKQLIKSVLRREVPSGKLPFDVGAIVHNVATTYAIYEAVYLGKPLYERVVTVAGDCLEHPANLLARVGTPIKDLIELCGPLKKEPVKIVFGGPMMGISQYSLDTPIIKSTNGIILFSKNEVEFAEEKICIRCARCVEHCPMGLMPCMMSLASEKEKWDLAKAYGCMECMECGACNYVCPQKRNIVQAIKHAKLKIK